MSNLVSPSGSNEGKVVGIQEAFFGIAYCCSLADGEINIDELHSLFALFSQREIFKGIVMTDLFDRVNQLYTWLGPEKLIEEACNIIPASFQETVFAVSVDVILSDGYLAKREEDTITLLKHKLSITDSFADKTVEVLLAKNKG